MTKDNLNNRVENFENAFHALSDYLVRCDFKGYEYDDLLASPVVRTLTFNSLWLKIISVQISKRFFINLRPLLSVPKLHSTKGFGFAVKGYLMHYLATGDEQYLPLVTKALNWLIENRSTGYSGYCWGNDFEFASRTGIYKKGLPTIVWSSHIQEAFDLAYQVLKEERYKEVVVSIAEFTENDLARIPDASGFCIAYAPGINAVIHNSNLLGAVALLRGWKYSGKNSMLEAARQSLNWSLSKQNKDGSWHYGELEIQHWIDNYHTGYVLDCLCNAQSIGGIELVPEKAIQSTYDFWINNLFEANGRPKFYHNQRYPTDIQACAQAIESFSKYSKRNTEATGFARKVAQWTLNNMQKQNGSFRYRIYKYATYNLEAIHWGQATMLSALGHLLYFCSPKKA